MLRSMTGYGRGENRTELAGYTVEIRTVNHRFSDFTIKLPREILQLEDRVRNTLQQHIARGKADVFITAAAGQKGSRTVEPDFALISAYRDAFRAVSEQCDLPGLSLDARTVLSIPDAFSLNKEETDPEVLWSVLEPAVLQAAEKLLEMRTAEGARLKENLLKILSDCELYFAEIRKRAPLVPADYRERLTNRLQELDKTGADPQRIATEVALFADRACIDEEITRLDSHIVQFRKILESEESVGKKLDFLVQEMNREVNTMGSKANDITITNNVLLLKSEIEKIREQIQNIE